MWGSSCSVPVSAGQIVKVDVRGAGSTMLVTEVRHENCSQRAGKRYTITCSSPAASHSTDALSDPAASNPTLYQILPPPTQRVLMSCRCGLTVAVTTEKSLK